MRASRETEQSSTEVRTGMGELLEIDGGYEGLDSQTHMDQAMTCVSSRDCEVSLKKRRGDEATRR
jgi:hypothetical protein